jgi:hypothetical protein
MDKYKLLKVLNQLHLYHVLYFCGVMDTDEGETE